MRVGIVCGAGIVSGKEIMALELARGLRQRGLRVEVVTSLWGDGEFARRLVAMGFEPQLMYLGFISAALSLEKQRMTAVQIARWPQLVAAYRRFLGRGRPQRVVHTNWHHLLLLYPFLRRERDLFWVHEMMPSTPRYRSMLALLDRRLNGFIAVSNAVARSLEVAGVPAGRVQVLHNGVHDSFGARREPPASRLRFGIVGQVAQHKGHADLVAAFAGVVARYPHAELHVFGAGDPGFSAALRRDIEERGLVSRVVWHGFTIDRHRIFDALDICVVPSQNAEPFGLVAIESALAGLPLVASRCGGLLEIVVDGVTGLLFEPGDRPELMSRLLELAGDAERRREMGLQARARATRCFSEATFIDGFAGLLGEEALEPC